MSQPSDSRFTIRDFQKRDFDALFKLDRLCFEPGVAYSRPELSSFIEQRRSYTIVAEWNEANEAIAIPAPANAAEVLSIETAPLKASGNNAATPSRRTGAKATAQPNTPRAPIAGFVTFHLKRQEYGHIITLDVHPDARRQRLGTLLMQAACDKLRQLTAFMVVLEVAVNNHTALSFYDRHGFQRIKVLEGYYHRGLDAIFMTKRL